MKKIMFNDKYGLTKSVLEGRKTQTRRIVPESTIKVAARDVGVLGGDFKERIIEHSPYLYNEVIAVAQKYYDFRMPNGDVTDEFYKLCCKHHMPLECLSSEAGATNKMFVKAELMPHHIRITNIRVEKLQEIGWDDCIKEGILEALKHPFPNNGDWAKLLSDCVYGFPDGSNFNFYNQIEAFAALIDKVSGKGTWDSNPYVFVYDFKLVD